MSLLLPTALLVIVFVVIAMAGSEGLWSNAITLVNVVTAALLATNFWEPVADLLIEQFPQGTYLWDFSALWGLFAVGLIVVRAATYFASRVKVRFPKLVEILGGYLFAVWIGWVMVCFTAMTLHTAPLSREFMFGGFKPEKRILGLAPDRQWLAFMQRASRGAFARRSGESLQIFDPHGDFIIKYATRRERFARMEDILVK
jgi:hypothetical protein